MWFRKQQLESDHEGNTTLEVLTSLNLYLGDFG